MMNTEGKRILHVYSSWTAGGAEKLMLSLAAGLEQKGTHNIIACPDDSYMYARARELGLTAHHLVVKGSFDPVGFVRLLRIVRRENVDIVHAHQGKVFWPCIFLKWLSGGRIRVVFHRHAQLPHRFYSRGHYHHADRVIAISAAVADGLRERDKVPPGKIRIVYNGTDFGRFNREIPGEKVRAKYGLGSAPVIGTVAAMNRPRGKGQEYLVEAARIVRERYPEARYLIVGTGAIEEELKEFACTLGVENAVIFAGYQEEVENYIAAMDIFCFLSWDTEGFGQVMVEAQGMGKPVVGTEIGGIPETLKDGVTGIIIPPRNPEALARALMTLLGDEAKRRRMGEEAVRFVTERFGIDAMVDNVREVYGELYQGLEE